MTTLRPNMVALVSGGVDSLVLVHTLLRQRTIVVPVYMRCRLVWEPAELFWLKRWLAALRSPALKTLQMLDLPMRSVYGAHWSLTGRGIPSFASDDDAVYLPGRNVLLLSHAATYAACQGISTVALGVLSGNPFGDASPAFFRRFSRCLGQALEKPVRICTPLRRSSKARLIAAHRTLPFHLTFSCLHPRGVSHCGRCNKCAERQHAFHQANVSDPTTYAG